MVRMDVARHERRHAERLGEVAQGGVAARVATFVRALELDEEAVSAERARESGGAVGIAHGKTVTRAARETEEAFVQLFQQRLVERRVGGWLRLLSGWTRVRVRRGEQAAEICIALLRLDEQRHMRAIGERDLGAGDRAHAEVLRRVRELERAVDAVVVGQRKCRIAELGGLHRELLRQRRSVEERVRRVCMQLDIRNLAPACGTVRPAAFRQTLFLAGAVRKLGLQLDRHTRQQWTRSCSGPAKESRSSTGGSSSRRASISSRSRSRTFPTHATVPTRTSTGSTWT